MGVLYELVMQRTLKEREIEKARLRKDIAKFKQDHRELTKYWSMENRLKEDLIHINTKIQQNKGAY